HEPPIAAMRNGLLYVPRSYDRSKPAPLIVLLHGAGGRARNWFGSYGARSETLGAIMLAPESRGSTWDAIHGDFGPDIPFVNSALRYTFEHCAIDPRRIALAGFSDGATYAISLGMANGDLFTHIVAFSPGFVREHTPVGKPPIFISHGTRDQILPIEVTSRAIVPALKRRGYSVEYVEFDGRHEVPPAISTQGWEWFLR
ncbi:MAG: phospholipase, partial [Gemmatimonadota bacterium]